MLKDAPFAMVHSFTLKISARCPSLPSKARAAPNRAPDLIKPFMLIGLVKPVNAQGSREPNSRLRRQQSLYCFQVYTTKVFQADIMY